MPAEKIQIALITERKNPPDKRVAFSPDQCRTISRQFPHIEFLVEPSNVRCITDLEYEKQGIRVTGEIQNAGIFFGIKEVPVEYLSKGKTYFFFSHTIKKQAHNRKLLQALLSKGIEMVDYECLLDENGGRTVAFGRFAGIVGAYNGLRMWLMKKSVATLPPASACPDMAEMIGAVRPFVSNLDGIKIVVTGTGRVGLGALEVLDTLGIKRLDPKSYLEYAGSESVYTVLSSRHYFRKGDSDVWNEADFRADPKNYKSEFRQFAACSDVLISCHYWNPSAPALFLMEDIAEPDFRVSVISDVTCDIGGSIPTTIRASSIEHPFYDITRKDGKEATAFSAEQNITVCAVDNLPCELPYDASIAFGKMLMEHVIPELVSDQRPGIKGATICRHGELTSKFLFLKDFAEMKED
jgi:saccharopine dehydrogenase (NAD+, L-lysine-forming)